MGPRTALSYPWVRWFGALRAFSSSRSRSRSRSRCVAFRSVLSGGSRWVGRDPPVATHPGGRPTQRDPPAATHPRRPTRDPPRTLIRNCGALHSGFFLLLKSFLASSLGGPNALLLGGWRSSASVCITDPHLECAPDESRAWPQVDSKDSKMNKKVAIQRV